MAFKEGGRDNKIYAVIAIFIIVVIIFTMLLSPRELKPAIIEENILDKVWTEDLKEREANSGFLGLEKWVSYTYKNNYSRFPAYVTITSIKTLFMMSEEDLNDKTLETIQKSSELGIVIDENSKTTGIRAHDNGHKTSYIIYYGNDTTKDPYEQIKIIGENWNCGISGNSVICIGFAQITNNSETNTVYWEKIIRDEGGIFGPGIFKGEDGLIYNVKCH